MVSPPPSFSLSPTQRSASTLQPASSRPPIHLAIFGAGRWGTHLLRNFVQHPQAKIVAIVDPCAARLTAASTQFQLDEAVVPTCDGSEAIALPTVEAVVIATPAATHHSLIRAALQQGLHVFAEKPLTLDVEEALELCRLAAERQRQLVIDHTYLFHPAVRRGQAVMQQAGDLRYGYASRTHLSPVRSDVDALWDLAIHDIAIFNHWLNDVPVQVQAQGKVWLQTGQSVIEPAAIGSSQGLSDLVWVKLTYTSGFQASLHLCWSNPDKQRRFCVVGSQGTLVFDELNLDAPLTFLQGKLAQNPEFLPIDQQRHVLSLDAVEPLQQVCHHFLTCVQGNTPSEISSGWLGAELVQILAALTQSLRLDGHPVSLNLR